MFQKPDESAKIKNDFFTERCLNIEISVFMISNPDFF